MADELYVYQGLDKALNILQLSEDKSSKKSALGDLRRTISQSQTSELGNLYTKISKCLNLCFQDRFEMCREQSILITIDLLDTLEPNSKYLVSLISCLQRRLVRETSMEPSEEIRLLLVKLLCVIVDKYGEYLPPFMEDIVEILSITIGDSAPEVKKKSCSCTIALSRVTSHEFYKCSPKLIEPLVDSVIHQHWRVRAEVIETIGSVIQNGDNKCIPDVVSPLAKRLFDDSPNVRMAVTRVVGNWLINLPDRYSYFPVLLPLILTSLTDECDAIKKEAHSIWTTAGKQYLHENEKDYKDRIDYVSDVLEHYPPNVVRPHLGCRVLAERECGKFLLALGREICDWVVSVRIKSAQLLTQVVLHAEASVTQQVHKIVSPMCKAAMDEEQLVVRNVMLAAEYVGYFVPASVYCKLIVETMGEANYGELRVVSGLVRGSRKEELVEHLHTIGSLLNNPTFKGEEQKATLILIESVFLVCNEDSLLIGEDIFLSIISVIGLAATREISEKALGLFSKFCRLGDDDRRSFVNKYCGKVLSKLNEASTWTVHCHQQYILDAIVVHAGEVIDQNVETLLSVLRKALCTESDPEAVLKAMMATNNIIALRETTMPSDKTFNIFINTLLSDILKEELKWRAGRSAEAIRTAATSCLYTCLTHWQKTADSNPDNDNLVRTEVVPLALSLLEDSATKTRILATKALAAIASMLSKMPLVFSDVMLNVLKRLDDCDKLVRQVANHCVQCLYREHARCLAEKLVDISLDNGLLEFVFATLLIHLDDQDSNFQISILDTLKCIAPLNVELLKGKAKRTNFRDKDMCETLLSFLDGI